MRSEGAVRASQVVCVLYAALAFAGAASALYYGLPYWTSAGASFSGFRALAFSNGPAATLSADVVVLYLLANVWTVYEGRRLGMSRLWAYVLANTLVAVALGLALFLFVRERYVQKAEGERAV